MDSTISLTNVPDIRKIEDVIDLQKAKGHLGARQVAFSVSVSGESRRARRRRRRRARSSSAPRAAACDSDVTVLRVRTAAPGDGLHRADGCSMVNLATLVQPAKHSVPPEEYLLPLTSWEPPRPPPTDSASLRSRATPGARLARFLRLYFCPCCTCLYEMEKMCEDRSVYLTHSRSPDLRAE